MMIEDLPANLKPAKEMGMTTVLVDQDLNGTQKMDGFVDYEIADILDTEEVIRADRSRHLRFSHTRHSPICIKGPQWITIRSRHNT